MLIRFDSLPPSVWTEPEAGALPAVQMPADLPAAEAASQGLTGQGGPDALIGGDGPDHFDGGPGGDLLFGRDGQDYARYGSAATGITASLMNPAASTGDAAGDRYVDIEAVVGSQHDDIMVGDNAPNEVHGQGGNDIVLGLGGEDSVVGGEGDDLMDGGPGMDIYDGGGGRDVYRFVAGEVADDTIVNFKGAGPAAGDTMVFVGYPTDSKLVPGPGKTFEIIGAEGMIVESILIQLGSQGLNASDYRFE